MLSFFEAFMSPSVLVLHDANTDENILMIHKNGSTALARLAKSQPDRYSIIEGINFEKLTVFVRDPIERIISGLHTMEKLSDMPIDYFVDIIERVGVASIMNTHIMPQFLYLIRSQSQTFQIEPMDNINRLVKTKKTSYPMQFTKETTDRLILQYTEDAILSVMGEQEISIDSLISMIRRESNYVEHMKEYVSYIEYLEKIIK